MEVLSVKTVEDNLTSQYELNPKITVMEKIGKKFPVDEAKLNFLSTNLPFGLDLVVVRPSPIHGNGVFAKVDIPSGRLITFYPGDRAKYCPNKDVYKDGHLAADLYSERVEEKYTKEQLRELDLRGYQFDISDKWVILGDPSFTEDANYLGHMINDGAKPNKNPKSNHLYTRISEIKSNCKFYSCNDLHIAIIATKDIKAGEELFITYGLEFWSTRV